jgi:hypothetical protein
VSDSGQLQLQGWGSEMFVMIVFYQLNLLVHTPSVEAL